MNPGGMQFAASKSDGISLPLLTSHGLAPWAANLRIFEPDISIKSFGLLLSMAFIL
jgi:hypothetical protein